MDRNLNRRDLLKTGGLAAGSLAMGMHSFGVSAQDISGGEQVFPGDVRYPGLVQGNNLRFTGSPSYVALCSSSAEVTQAVQLALDQDLRITVLSGGHCYEDFAVGNDGGVIIDLARMSSVGIDPETGWYEIQAGALLLSVYTELAQQYGVTVPGGSCATVGAGGHISGGGYGLLSRLHGLTVDYLHAVEMVHVTADGRAELVLVQADSADPDERDLLWSCQGGGGGNFGIVTRFLFRELPAIPGDTWLSFRTFDWEMLDRESFGRLIRNYGEFLAENSGVDSPYNGLFPLLALSQRGAGHIGLSVQYVGDEPWRLDEFDAAIGAGLDSPPAEVQVYPWLTATGLLSGGGPALGKYKSAYMIEPFPDQQIEVMWNSLSNPSVWNPSALLQVDGYGGRINAVDSAATAVPQRSSIMKLQYQAYWSDPADGEANLEWIRSFYTEMYGEQGPVPDGIMDGCYVNYPDVDLVDWQVLYYKGNYPRLQHTKARWDPLNVFNHQQSVELPG